jgi:hypothetical protein
MRKVARIMLEVDDSLRVVLDPRVPGVQEILDEQEQEDAVTSAKVTKQEQAVAEVPRHVDAAKRVDDNSDDSPNLIKAPGDVLSRGYPKT